MSHITKLQTQMTDLDCIKEALQENNFNFSEGGVAKAYGSRTIKGDLVVNNGRAYDIAFVKQNNGTYSVEADWYSGGPTRQQFIKQITQSYAVAKTLKAVKKNPKLRVIKQEKLANGTRRIRVGVMG